MYSCLYSDSFAFLVPLHNTEKAVKDLEKCAHCTHLIPETGRLDHVGRHLLLKRDDLIKKEGDNVVCVPRYRPTTDANLPQVTIIEPCGFCGRSDNPLCQQLMLKESPGRGTAKILSSCPSFYPARYGSAAKSSSTRPSTNVPIVCQVCFLPVDRDFTKPCLAKWKYNMDAHIQSAHPGCSTPTCRASKLVPFDMAAALNLGPQEENLIGVSATTPWTQLGYPSSS
jgi:hypothetical protein